MFIKIKDDELKLINKKIHQHISMLDMLKFDKEIKTSLKSDVEIVSRIINKGERYGNNHQVIEGAKLGFGGSIGNHSGGSQVSEGSINSDC